MKTIFKKDLRENFKIALIGLAVFTVVIVLVLRGNAGYLKEIVKNSQNVNNGDLQPLLSVGFLSGAAFFCGIFGTALGWFQARNEGHRDLWAFLVHRPVTRSQIFLGKTAAGLCLYCLGAGLPVAGMVWYVVSPGCVAAPFEPAMILPVLAVVLTGAAYYFAGLLTGLRQARWFGSRTFGFAAAFFASAFTFDAAAFWQALLMTVLMTAILAVAVWGAYQTGGFYRGQPVAGKLGLALSMACGTLILLLLAAYFLQLMFFREPDSRWQNYVMMRDGRVCIETSRNGESTYTALDGKPFLDPETGKPIETKKFNHSRAGSLATGVFNASGAWWNTYANPAVFFNLWKFSSKTLWYFDRHGKLVGFSGITGRPVGDIVAPNRAENFLHPGDSWGVDYRGFLNQDFIFATASAIYRLDYSDRTLTPIFTAAPDDPIISYCEGDRVTYLDGEVHERHKVLFATHHTVHAIDSDGKSLFALPYQPGPETYPDIQLAILDIHTRAETNSSRFALTFLPDNKLNEKSGWNMPEHVEWISDGEKITKTLDLPSLHPSYEEGSFDKIIAWFTPPVLGLSYADHRVRLEHSVCLIPAALVACLGWLIARRYHFPARAAIAWMLFCFAGGIPGLLAFLVAEDWPRRENCPNCKQLRTVDREHCEHCGTAFPPPDKIGIEIFEPIALS